MALSKIFSRERAVVFKIAAWNIDVFNFVLNFFTLYDSRIVIVNWWAMCVCSFPMFHNFAVYLRLIYFCIENIIECTFFQLPVFKIPYCVKNTKNTSQIKSEFITQQFVYSANHSSFPIFNIEIPHEQESSSIMP